MKKFDYLAPTNLGEALEMLRDRPEAKPLAGGTDVLIQLKDGRISMDALVSLKRIPELQTLQHNGKLTIGSAVTTGQIAADKQIQESYTALALGTALIGSVQIRNMATVGGNICNASPSADSVPPLLALGAEIVLANAQGERTVPLNEFYLGPGETVMQPGELLKEIVVPKPPKGSGSYYLRHTPRAWMDIATVGVAAYISLDKVGKIAKSRIALGAVAPTPIRAVKAESLLQGQSPVEDSLEEAGMVASQEASPISDVRASAEYRKHLVSVLTQRALHGALEKAEGNR